MQTKLIVPIPAQNPQQAKQQIKAAINAGAEMLELRVDYLEELSVETVVKLVAEVKKTGTKSLPVIVTCRDKRQGGARGHHPRLRVDVLTEAVKAGADYIDFEYDNFLITEDQERIRLAVSQYPKSRLILSAHNFQRKFDNIGKLYRDITTISPGAIPKLVYTANHINDCFEAFDLLHRTSGERIVFCMGEAGLISRIIAKKLNSLVTFASIGEESATAPGQLTIKQFEELYRYDKINAETELFGVIADPVGHSLSPVIHNACFGEKKMNRLYLPLWIQGGRREFDSFMHRVLTRKWLNFKGFSITIPHKQSAIDFVRVNNGFVEPLAEKIGAANTLLIGPNGKLFAYNTDYAGALDAITSGMSITRSKLKSMPVAVVGAGGVSRAIVAGLSDVEAKIKIYNRTIEKAEKLAAEFDCEFAPLDDLKNLDAKLLVNCTSIGMHPNIDAMPVPKETIKKGIFVFDTVYNPAQTLLLKEAKKKRAKTIDGISMFVNQAMAQFKLFTNTSGNAELMRKTILDRLFSKQ
jgi:3-dehydroquinate dehydratase/shikimate dehydrogenase